MGGAKFHIWIQDHFVPGTFCPLQDRKVIVVVDLDGNKGKSRFCKHVLLTHKAMLGKAM
jgi:hypothetical protein